MRSATWTKLLSSAMSSRRIAKRAPSKRAAESEERRHVVSRLAAAAMNPGQQEILQRLIAEYIHRMPDELAEIEAARLHQTGIEQVHFAWAGGIERRQGHYYRLQAPNFLVEYDNTQNDANHIHSVWRDPANDFGADILARHYAHEH